MLAILMSSSEVFVILAVTAVVVFLVARAGKNDKS